MKKKILITFLLLIALVIPAVYVHAYSTKGLKAYPVPFHPNRGVLTINDFSGVTFHKVKIQIFDINGDKVYTTTYPGYPAIWNGRNDRGRIVKPGMYILIIEAENILTGLHGKKTLRILVAR